MLAGLKVVGSSSSSIGFDRIQFMFYFNEQGAEL